MTQRARPGNARRVPVRGGEPRTIGYWKNWNRCTGGNQAAVAEANGGPDAAELHKDPAYNPPDELKDIKGG